MPESPSPVPLDDRRVLLLVGTTKGAFLFHADPDRGSWCFEGPHFPGEEVYAMALDQREGRRTLWAAPGNAFFGTTLRKSEDGGGSWSPGEARPVAFPEDSDLELKRIWQIRPGRETEPERLFLGVEPSCLFETRDGGESWSPVSGLLEHEHRERWTPGAGGLCLHTIVLDPEDPDRMAVALSTGGVYRTDDGGATWRPRNEGVRAEFLPDKHPEFGQCVHKVAHHPDRPERLFLQNHWGLYRSDDWGERWTDIANGVPSDFGFGMATHPRDPDTVYIVPMESDQFRCCPEAKLRVYRTRNAGESWEPLTEGLPQEDAYETVLRDALDTDEAEPAGVYFGTRSGRLYGSRDDGDSWALIHEGLPPVVCVKAAVIREA
ncbi:MAG: exo-alpha-sialidase [Gemmatimonadota bacterium]|nr:exo-alpha-sialidase [Gemmatimonadota bacterium]